MKYYITMGKNQMICLASNPYQACMKVFKRTIKNVETLPKFFRISQVGFNKHDDDEIVPMEVIIKLMVLSNNYNRSKTTKRP